MFLNADVDENLKINAVLAALLLVLIDPSGLPWMKKPENVINKNLGIFCLFFLLQSTCWKS